MPIKSDEKESCFRALQRLPWNSVDDEWCTLRPGMCIIKKLTVTINFELTLTLNC